MDPIRFRWRDGEFLAMSPFNVRHVSDREQASELAHALLEAVRRSAAFNSVGLVEEDALTRMIERGDIVFTRLERPERRLDPPRVHDLASLAEVPIPGVLQPDPAPREPTFLEIEVVHECGATFEGAEFGVQLPDGTLTSGTLGHDSTARIDDVRQGGQAHVRFKADALKLKDTPPSSPLIPEASDVRIGHGTKLAASIRTGRRQRIVVEYANAHVLEVEDVTFGFNRALLLPDAVARPSAEPGPARPEGVAVLEKALVFMKTNPRKRFLAVGHTDAVGSEASNLQLSEARARGIHLQLLGRHSEWGEHALGVHTGEDLQRYLGWTPLHGLRLRSR